VSPVASLVYQPLYRGYESLVDVRRALNVLREVDRIPSELTVGPVSIPSSLQNRHFVSCANRNVCCTYEGKAAVET